MIEMPQRENAKGKIQRRSFRKVAGSLLKPSVGCRPKDDAPGLERPLMRPCLLRSCVAAGVLVLLAGAFAAIAARGGEGSPVRFTASATLPALAGLDCYKIETDVATYYLEKSGAGLAALIDRDGNDWIGFHPEPGSGAAGEFRGFPNAVHRQAGNYFHPKNQNTDPSTTRVDHVGPDRVTISATSGNGLWECRYDFFPSHCTFTMTKMAQGYKYWVLYEGTPGGQYDDTDWWMTSAVKEPQPMTTNHEGDIPAPEWIVFGDRALDRVLFVVHHEDDEHPDRFYQMNQQMTVFGFGREGLEKFLDSVPQSFSIGLLETTDHGEISRALERKFFSGLQAAGPFPAWKHLSSAAGDLPAPGIGREQTSLLVLDIDKDGLNDIVVAERSAAPAVVWLRRERNGWVQFVIEDGRAPIAAGGTFCDVSGNGYPDLIFGSAGVGGGKEVWWWENPGPPYDAKTPWQRHAIATDQPGQHHDQLAGDFLGEGRPQIVSWYQGGGKLLLFPIPANPRQAEPWPAIEVAGGAELKRAEGLAKGDIDGDGKLDIVGGGRWFRHLGGTNFATYVIDDAQTFGRVAVGDLNNNGRLEVVMVIGDGIGRLKWYERTGDPTQTRAWQGHDLLGVEVTRGHSLQIADLSGDGNLDIFCAEMAQWTRGEAVNNPESRAWIFYGDGQGNFIKTELAAGFDFHEAKVADVNGNGRLDIVNKPFIWQTPRIDIWLNEGSEKGAPASESKE